MPSSKINDSMMYIKGVGPKRAEAFGKIGIHSIRDLLFRFPYKHLDRTTLLTTAQAYGYINNGYDGEITIIGRVIMAEVYEGRRKFLIVKMRDKEGGFDCLFFQGVKYFKEYFNKNDLFAISGKPVISKYNILTFTHPDYDLITEEEGQTFFNTGKIIPVYSQNKELKETNTSDLNVRRIMTTAVEKYVDYLDETLPSTILNSRNLLGIIETVTNMHFPESKELLDRAMHRLKFEEAFYLQIIVNLRRLNYKEKQEGISQSVKTKLVKNFLGTIPFELTKAQLKVLSEIRADMASEKPMNRLLQGDVGSGKTITALIAMLIAIDNHHQAALAAPTEILAVQHFETIQSLLEPLNQTLDKPIIVTLLIGGMRKKQKEETLGLIKNGIADIVIGTHALFEEAVTFKSLSFAIIDEQHRFGVEQRGKLKQQNIIPDVLVMSATPIPRTLSMSVYGDLDISVLDEMPKNRKPVKTSLVGESTLPEVYNFIIKKAKEGIQSFIVYPLINDSDKLELRAAETYYAELSQTVFKDLKLGLLHGRLSIKEKDEIMLKFRNKEFDILFATTVIEVGVDIPNANIMLINNAERFGLAQLHQLRGRVGRGEVQAYCILVTKDEIVSRNFKLRDIQYLSPLQIERYKTHIRLHSMVKYSDGFNLAETDLKLRGPGNIYGTEQSGMPNLKYIDLTNDIDIIVLAKRTAEDVLKIDPELASPNYCLIKNVLKERFAHALSYALIA